MLTRIKIKYPYSQRSENDVQTSITVSRPIFRHNSPVYHVLMAMACFSMLSLVVDVPYHHIHVHNTTSYRRRSCDEGMVTKVLMLVTAPFDPETDYNTRLEVTTLN